jgi:putative ABC transport system permease protein
LTTPVRELRYAFRSLLRAPGVSIIAVIALGLGIGLTTVMFSIVYGALYRGLPFEAGDRLMALERSNPGRGAFQIGVTIHDFRDWQARQRSFEDLAAFYQGTVNVRAAETPERYQGAFVTANTMAILGEEPQLGRAFTADDERSGAPLTLLLSFTVWRDHFGSDPGVLGRSVTVNGEAATIVGVMPEGFMFPERQEVWVPLRLDPVAIPRGQGQTVTVFGKLREGTTLETARTEFTPITDALAAAYPDTNQGVVAQIQPFTEDFIGDEERSTLLAMLATVVLVLLIACANVANLLLARAAVKTRDLAIRVALGASRTRVIIQLLGESLVLALGGAVLGTALAWVGIGLFDRAVAATDPPFWLVFRLDGPILAFVIGVAAVAALVSGGIPALRSSSTDLNAVLKDESRGSSSLHIGKLSRALVIAEVAMSVAILVASGLMIKSVVRLEQMALPFPVEDVFTARIGLFETRFPDADSRDRFWQDVEERTRGIPGVRSTGLMTQLPGLSSGGPPLALDGASYTREEDMPWANSASVSPGFFEVFDVTALQGRLLNDLDTREAPPVAIVNESFVREFFPDGRAVGRLIRLGGLESTNPWREIVGVVPDLRMEGVGDTSPNPPSGLYMPLAQNNITFASLAARTDGPPLAITGEVRSQVSAADQDTPIYFVDTLRARIDEELWFYGVFGTLFAVFGAAALFMASVGLYGVMSFSVSRRVLEMGIRMALGAQGEQVRRLVVRQGMIQIAVGLVLGTGLAVLVARGLRIFFLGAQPWDPLTYLLVFSVLALTGFTASAIPARRATRVHPSVALRGD